ncbi:hypothetical protein [Streptomyces sp. NPDC053079]|uniref:hypothetical protein n=1 Tax=Streptomyces sp. NPDC053079 TaxID=3365697 RepID=UPI0037CEE6E2
MDTSLPFETAQAIVTRHAESVGASTLLTAKREEHEREQAAAKWKAIEARYDSRRPSHHGDEPDDEPAAIPRPLAVGEFVPIPAYLRERLHPQNNSTSRSRRYPMAVL